VAEKAAHLKAMSISADIAQETLIKRGTALAGFLST
jgi:hypothetical protein